MRTKVTYIISNINKAIAFEWIATHIDAQKTELSFILLNPTEPYLFRFLKEHNIETYYIPFHGKKEIPAATWKCYRLLSKIKPAAVHCHLFEANIIGLTAAKLAGIRKRIYTRHHSTFHHEYFPKAVKWDKYSNRLATHIVAISETVKQVLLKEKARPEKITIIHHGFDLKAFETPDPASITVLSSKHNPAGMHPVIGVISRFVDWKGVQYIIPAFTRLRASYPNARLLLFNASGNFEPVISSQLAGLPENAYQKIVFEPDIASLYHIFDLFIHVPVNEQIEAFGQTYIECMASGIPLIATRSGIGFEILNDKVNSLVVPHKNSDAIFEAMHFMLQSPDVAASMSRSAMSSVHENFTIEKMVQRLEHLYLQ
ncbi:MAG: glycosyltransferase [Bacteroidetes bacterium]|nr:glycosyltransferase [Bacteroidota bacterium]